MPAPLPLRLIPAPAATPVQAGFLPGSDVAAWLAEMNRHAGARFFVVPDSAEEVDAGGLLILPAGAGAAVPKFGARVIPCSVEHERVAVPAGMRLDPRLSAEEAQRLLYYHAYFFHPVIGLVAFEETDAILPQSLIVPPLARTTSWMGAVPGRSQPPPLRQVLLTLPEEDDLFGKAGEDIGSLSPKDLQSKAPLLERLKDKLKGGAAGAGMGLLAGLGGLAKMLGAGKSPPSRPPPLPGQSKSGGNAGPGGPGMLERLQDWTAKQLEKLQQQRESEVRRLLRMLENNPELGLRHAIPFGGENAARGRAPTPGGSLMDRNPTYGRRGAGGPADVWNFSAQSQWALQQKYRELANRELAEGRYDRAAYIFAELLGDWHGAAGALARGRRFQEAAKIYGARLNNKGLAAKCLEDGGLLVDAVLLYAELGQHEKCGDLYRLLGREREAVAAFHEAIRGSKDRLHDARILFEKLNQQDLALGVLASGHPHSGQAGSCLETHFEYLGRIGATDAALALATSLADPARQLPKALAMVESLSAIYRQQGVDPEVQARLGSVAVGVIGTALSRSPEHEDKLLQMLPQFAPSDRLLKRDAGRFMDQRQRLRRKDKAAVARPVQGMSCRSKIKLPKNGAEWWCLLTRGKSWLALGHQKSTRQDVWVMGSEDRTIGTLTSASGWRSYLPLMPHLLPLMDGVWLPFARQDEEARYGQASSGDFSLPPDSRDQLVSRLNWMPPGVLAAHPVADGAWILHRHGQGTIDLSFYSYPGKLIRTHALGWGPDDLGPAVQMVAHDEEIFIAAGNQLLQVKHGHIGHQVELEHRVTQLSISRPTQRAAVLVVSGREVMLYAPGKNGDSIQLLSSATFAPVACFLADGRIVVGDGAVRLVYSAYPEAKLISSMEVGASDGLAPEAYAAWGDAGLAILTSGGVIECHA